MKAAALIFGILAGIIGVGIAALGTLDAGLAQAVEGGGHAGIISHFILAVIPGISLFSAGLALSRPRFAAVLLLITALAWIGLALLIGHGTLLFAAAPFTFAAAASWVAFFARNDFERGGLPAQALDMGRAGSATDERWGEQSLSGPRSEARLTRGREDPGFSVTDERQNSRPQYEDQGYRNEPFEEEDDDRPHFAPTYEDDDEDDRGIPGENYVSTRREYPSASREYSRSGSDYNVPSQRDDYREFEAYAPPQRPASRTRQIIGIVNLALFVAIVTGISLFLYFDYQRGPHSLIFGSHDAPAASTVSTASTASTASNAPAEPIFPTAPASTPVTPPTPAAATPAEAPPQTPATTQATASAALATYDDPLAFCNAIPSIDAPDQRFTGPKVPPTIAQALQIPGNTPPDQVHWRCLNHTLLACVANNTHKCDVTPTVEQMLAYCSKNPGAKDLPAPNGTWYCSDVTPVIPKDQKWPVDSRGFYPGAWILIPSSQAAPQAG